MWLLLIGVGCPPGEESGKILPPESRVDSTGTDSTGLDSAADSVDSGGCVPTAEVCDGADNDCDGAVDEEALDAAIFYEDGDEDGYGADGVTVSACEAPTGFVAQGGDCADDAPERNPGVTEICGDGIEQGCGGCAYSIADADAWIIDYEYGGHGKGAGDINGDGFDDLMFKGWNDDGQWMIQFMYGNDLKPNSEQSQIIFESPEPIWPQTLGDLNGDGRSEILLSSSYSTPSYIFSNIYSGMSIDGYDTLITDPVSVYAKYDGAVGDITGDGEKELAWLGCNYRCLIGSSGILSQNHSENTAIFRITSPFDSLGYSYNTNKDITGDGVDDVVISDYWNSIQLTNDGAVYVYAGPLLGEIDHGAWDTMWVGETEEARAGASLAVVNDLDQDGYRDIAAAAYSDVGARNAGVVYVVSGASSGALSFADAPHRILGTTINGTVGGVMSPGDLNQDGQDDLIMGSGWLDEANNYYTRKMFGFYNLTNVSSVEDSDFSIIGDDVSSAASCFTIGDINGDEIPDLWGESGISGYVMSFGYVFYGMDF